MKPKNQLKYIAYVRKSEEREERQQLSIPAQIEKIKQHFPGIKIIDWVEETRSAFQPHNRPVFEQIIERIKRGEADGIISYHPNRCSRNEIDAATLTYMLRKGELKDLKFCSYSFENSPEGIWMLQQMLSQGQYESSKLGREVKRGMEQKLLSAQEKPGVVPQGYMKVPILDSNGRPLIRPKDNKIVTKTDVDPERYDLVAKMWKMLLSGTYTAPQIWKIACEDWKYTTRKTKRLGGGPLAKASIYRIFTNPFYAGWIMHGGKMYEGHHRAMITLEQFDYAQLLLGDKAKPRIGVNGYAYTALIKCGVCGCQIVGKTNTKWVKREKKMKTYVHYHCTRRSDKRPCNQSVYTTLEKMEEEIDAELARYTILPEFRDLALKILRRNHKIEVKDRTQIYETQQKKHQQIQGQLDKLVDMRTKDLLDDDEYANQRNRLRKELILADESLRSTENRAEEWLELTEKAFNFATYARIHFANGDLQTKREILMTLGENLMLKDQKLYIQPREWLVPIAEKYPELEAKYLRYVRTNKKATSKVKEAALQQIFESWRAQWDSNPRHAA